MPIRVLVVDDSGFFRRRIVEILRGDADLEVVGEAADGQQAVAAAARLRPDVITMDIEMPVMDGITAVKQIQSRNRTPILMFSSLTHEGARATLDALAAGASDFMPKRFQDIARNQEEAVREFCARVRALGLRTVPARTVTAAPAAARAAARPEPVRAGSQQVVVIGASTGGPVALQTVLSQVPAAFPLPILVVQHMPAAFTGAFAERLDQVCRVHVKEAAEGDVLAPGTVYVAPGGRQMRVVRHGAGARIQIADAAANQIYKPSVDVTFDSVAEAYRGRVLAIMLTGMGADGCAGTRALKSAGAHVWAQDEQSCVIYGMPQAVVNAGLADCVLPVDAIGRALAQGH